MSSTDEHPRVELARYAAELRAPVEHSPAGDVREHAVACGRCRRATFNDSAVCDPCRTAAEVVFVLLTADDEPADRDCRATGRNVGLWAVNKTTRERTLLLHGAPSIVATAYDALVAVTNMIGPR